MWLCASKTCTTSVAFWSFCSSFWRFTCFLSSSLQPTTFWSGSGHHHRLPYCPHLFPPDSGACIWTSNRSVMWPLHPSARDLDLAAALGHSLLWGVDYLQSPKLLVLYQCYHRLHYFIQCSTFGICCWALRRPTTRLCRCSDAPGQRWPSWPRNQWLMGRITYFHCNKHICTCSCSFKCNPLISISINVEWCWSSASILATHPDPSVLPGRSFTPSSQINLLPEHLQPIQPAGCLCILLIIWQLNVVPPQLHSGNMSKPLWVLRESRSRSRSN